jgi:hypothetical protein
MTVRGTKTNLQDQVFQFAYQVKFPMFEKYKQDNNSKRIADEAYPVILRVENHSNKTINEIAIDVFLEIREGMEL